MNQEVVSCEITVASRLKKLRCILFKVTPGENQLPNLNALLSHSTQSTVLLKGSCDHLAQNQVKRKLYSVYFMLLPKSLIKMNRPLKQSQ